MIRIKTIAIFIGCAATIATGTLVAATLQLGSPSLILMAGQTIEIPLSSDLPIASDLTASGAFEDGDVTFTAGPGCHLSANGCTLIVTAAPSSKNYMAEPVIVSESAATNKPIFTLSVINPRGYVPHTQVSEFDSSLLAPSKLTYRKEKTAISNTAQHPRRPITLTSGDLSAEIEPHGSSTTYYSSSSNGPVYQLILVTNNGANPVTLIAPSITNDDSSSFSIDTTSSDYAGSPTLCSNAPTLASASSCALIITSTVGDPASTPKTANLTISDTTAAHTLTFNLTDTTYVYAAGGFNTLGHASVSGGDLLAECTEGACSNALDGSSGNNYASTQFSVGQWINALAVTPTGNLIVGGVFGAIGGATSGATSSNTALLAQCTPGHGTPGNACINQITSTTNPYAFNNGYIDAITTPILISGTSYIVLGGDFNQIRASSAAGRLLARCRYTGTTANATCANYISSSNSANAAISALDTLSSTSNAPRVSTGGLFTQIAGYPTSPPSSGTTFASCTTSACSQGNNPNNSILGMTDDGTQYLYMGGAFTQIGGYTDSSGGYPLVSCTSGTPTACVNALAGTDYANGYIEGLAYSRDHLYVGGKFTTIGGATPVSGGNMLAVCTPGGTCSNFVTGTNPYATGTDWGGNISAVAVGNQTTITAN